MNELSWSMIKYSGIPNLDMTLSINESPIYSYLAWYIGIVIK